MKQFMSMVQLEFLKLRGTYLLLVGIVTGIGAIGVSLYLAAADRMTKYTFHIFTGNVISNNMSFFFPFTVVLIIGQMMERERTCSTLNNIYVVPISFRKLLSAKIMAGAYIVVLYSFMQWILSILTCELLKLPGMTVFSAFNSLWTMVGMNLCVYIAILPITALTAQYANGYIAGLVFSVFYGFCSIFATGHGFTAAYPISAGLVLLRFNMIPTSSEVVTAMFSLFFMLILTVIFVLLSRDRTEVLSGGIQQNL